MKIRVRGGDGPSYVEFTNVSDDDATIFHLARRGYATVTELLQWDTPELFDLIEFERIQQDIEQYQIDQARER